ncbi:hypothetical protein BaRGS_00001968 [Batillaria attramentaria]|uniref:G-protein coupled receptors family 3 profile domain-containing protein n=1 Tax=Batillaria attramentaria TaxID=370345 RepID=A0ABD0M5R3_9CAEN
MAFSNTAVISFVTASAICISLLYRTDGVVGNFVVPGLPEKRFVKLGDINIGFLLPMSKRMDHKLCNGTLGYIDDAQHSQAVEYAFDQINKEGQLPGNITLGFVVLDDCRKEIAATAQSLAFVPQTTCTAPGFGNSNDEVTSYDVVGVIGSTRSSQTVGVAYVLGPAQIPLASFYSTSDDLSNKELFQFRAIFSIIQQYGWSYISVVYREGSYGENGFKQLRDLFDQHHVCLAAVHKVPAAVTRKLAEEVALDLVEHKNARVVVMITFNTPAEIIIKAASKLEPPGTFIWIASDGWAEDTDSMADLGQHLWDALLVAPRNVLVPEFDAHFTRLTPESTTDPWFPEFWDEFFLCSLDNGTCRPNMTVGEDEDHVASPRVSILLDTVYMFTNATMRVLNSPECRGRVGAAARACVTGPRLLQELKVTRQAGHTGWLELDENGDRLGKYRISQVVPAPLSDGPFELVTLAEFDSLTGNMTVLRNVTWAHHQPQVNLTHPESRCSWPCGPGEARVPQEVTCCWLCQPCRVNEYLAYNGTRSVFVYFHRHRNCRVIKASSRELSFLMLLAIAIGYVTMITLITPPNDVTCRVNFLLFCLSFALIYGPLLVRALRIYRIFEAGQKSAQRPRMIDSHHQLLFSFGFLSVQVSTWVLMCLVVMAVYPDWHKLTMKVALEPYVELSCDLPMAGLASFLAYNLLLVAVCAFLAFKTRRLPDNFNESRFISMCVTTTLVMWLAFIPGYLLAWREHLKMLMLALALALNHSTALVFLFLPKVYAVMYLEGAADTNATTVGRTVGTVGGVTGRVGRVGRVGTSHVKREDQTSSGWGTEEDGTNGSENGNFPNRSGPSFSKIHPSS